MSLDRQTLSMRALVLGLVLVVGVSAGTLIGYAVGRIGAGAAATSVERVLSGTDALQPEALAELAYERARLGAQWLAGVSRDDGSYYYTYDPRADEYDSDSYNEVRHAGTTYSMFQVYGALGGEEILAAAEGGVRYIDDHSEGVDESGRAFLYEGRMKLGGQALAIVALLERRRVLADTTHDDLIVDLAGFMLSLELDHQPGRYYQSYETETGEPSLEPDSDFYPGEALLAMTRLAQHFPDGPYLEHAVRAAEYLVHERDGDIPELGRVPREDHWLALALSELHRLHPEAAYREVAYLQAESMLGNQYANPARPMRIGGSSLQSPINHTSTATKAEALVAVWALAASVGDEAAADRYATAARRNIQFQMRVQYTQENTQLFPRPAAAVGAWGQDALEPWVRMDFVQHNISALIGVWYLTTEGDIPIAEPIG